MNSLIQTENSSLIEYDYLMYEELIEKCIDEIKLLLLERPEIILYGKTVRQGRNVGFFSDESEGYRYSNTLMKSQPLTENLKILLTEVNSKFDTIFNGILINHYINGENYIGPHSDEEKNLSSIGVVAISYGAERKFRIRDKNTKKIILDVPTKHCHILHMKGKFQNEFTHEIPVEKKIKNERYSLTFRSHKQ